MRVIHRIYLSLFLVLAAGGVQAREAVKPDAIKIDNAQKEAVTARPRVLLETSLGNILLELDPDKAPVSVENFVHYVKDGFYNGLIFHRVIPGFMVQGGGMKPDMSSVATRSAIKNEAKNGLSNRRGTIAMARTNDPDSATAQFFINEVDNGFLDPSSRSAGYAVFGHVVDGMNVVDAMSKVKTTRRESYSDVPEKNIVITKAAIVSQPKPEQQ